MKSDMKHAPKGYDDYYMLVDCAEPTLCSACNPNHLRQIAKHECATLFARMGSGMNLLEMWDGKDKTYTIGSFYEMVELGAISMIETYHRLKAQIKE